jgi:hypothetical protein
VDALEGRESAEATAGGGSSNDICSVENCDPSLPLISVEEAGVGGCSGRGITLFLCSKCDRPCASQYSIHKCRSGCTDGGMRLSSPLWRK